jgi:CDGSH-type Zn-finger protein
MPLTQLNWGRLLTTNGALASFMRKVLKSDQRPFEIKPQQESVWICMCGLSKNQPFCDGSHKTTRDEEDGKTYEYDSEGHATKFRDRHQQDRAYLSRQ